MFVPMWLIVVLVLFSALGVWTVIFVCGILSKLVDEALGKRKKPQTGEQK